MTAVGRFGVRFYYGANSFQDLGMHDTAVDAAVAYARFAASQAAESDTRNGPMANGLTCQAAPAEEEVEKDDDDDDDDDVEDEIGDETGDEPAPEGPEEVTDVAGAPRPSDDNWACCPLCEIMMTTTRRCSGCSATTATFGATPSALVWKTSRV